jgi:hypothetical protein
LNTFGSDIRLDSSWGLAARLGVNYMLNEEVSSLDKGNEYFAMFAMILAPLFGRTS